MKKIHIIVMILLATLFNGMAANSEVHNNQVIQQTITNADTLASEDSDKPITKTVIMEGDEEQDVPYSRNKWVTVALAAFGVGLVIVFRMLRKKKTGKTKE